MSKRVTITLHDEHYDLLSRLSKYYGHPPATLAGDMLVQAMFDAEEAVYGETTLLLGVDFTGQRPN